MVPMVSSTVCGRVLLQERMSIYLSSSLGTFVVAVIVADVAVAAAVVVATAIVSALVVVAATVVVAVAVVITGAARTRVGASA